MENKEPDCRGLPMQQSGFYFNMMTRGVPLKYNYV
jgi:hypothetical protein